MPRSGNRPAPRAGSLARRHRRQDLLVLVTASLAGVWLGFGAPSSSPVVPPPAPAAQQL